MSPPLLIENISQQFHGVLLTCCVVLQKSLSGVQASMAALLHITYESDPLIPISWR